MYNPLLTRRKFYIGFGGLVMLAMGTEVYNISLKAEHEYGTIATFSGTPAQLRKEYEGNIIKRRLPKHFRPLNQGLAFIVDELSKNSSYLARNFKRGQVNIPIKVYIVDYSRGVQLGNKSYYVSLTVQVPQTGRRIIDLVAYLIEGSEGNVFVRRQGDSTREVWYANYGVFSKQWVIEEKAQRPVMNEIDVTGIRAKLLKGLRKQKLL